MIFYEKFREISYQTLIVPAKFQSFLVEFGKAHIKRSNSGQIKPAAIIPNTAKIIISNALITRHVNFKNAIFYPFMQKSGVVIR